MSVIEVDFRSRLDIETRTFNEIVNLCISEVFENWTIYDQQNKLNDLFLQKISYLPIDKSEIFLQNLNSLSRIEAKIGLNVQVISPNFNNKQKSFGWISAFHCDGHLIATPFMASESLARTFAILLFLEIKNRKR